MADFNLPSLDSQYEDFINEIKAKVATVAQWFDGTTDTNIPIGSKRFSSSNKRFEKYNGTTWEPLIPNDSDPDNAYDIRVEVANSCAGSSGSSVLATNALNLGGTPAADFVQTDDSRLTDSRTCNNMFDNAATSRTALSVSTTAEMNAALASKANLASPSFLGVPTVPTAAVGTNTTQAASTAFVRDSFRYGAQIALAPFVQTGWIDDGSFAVPIYQRGVIVASEIYLSAYSSVNAVTTLVYQITSDPLYTLAQYMGYTAVCEPYDMVYLLGLVRIYRSGSGPLEIAVDRHMLSFGVIDYEDRLNAQIKIFAKAALSGHT